MLSLWRIAGHRLSSSILHANRNIIFARSLKMRIKPYRHCPMGDYDEYSAKWRRPMSPHLTIYKPELTSMLSITHRLTGLATSGYIILLALSPAVFNNFDELLCFLDTHLSNPQLFFLKLIVAAPFAYHLCNGTRHLTWDTGRMLGMKEVYSSAYVMLVSAAVFCAILMSL